MVVDAFWWTPPVKIILCLLHAINGSGIVNQLLRLNAQLFATTGTSRVHHQQDQVAVRNFLNAERSISPQYSYKLNNCIL